LIAGNNMLDQTGGKADFFMLKLHASYADACLIGATHAAGRAGGHLTRVL
jgi:hypothetical protein